MWRRVRGSCSRPTTRRVCVRRWGRNRAFSGVPRRRTLGLTFVPTGRTPAWTESPKEVPMKDLTVSLEDRPGTLADLGEAFGKAGINIEGLTVVAFEGRAIGHVLVEDASAARSVLEGAGIKVEGESDPLISDIDSGQVDEPGVVGNMARALADAGVNIQVVYLATKNRAVAVTSDNEKARQALGL